MSESLLPLHEVTRRTGHSRASIYVWIADGRFPAPLKVGRRSLWVESEVQEAIDAIIATAPRMGQSMGARTQGVKKAA